MSELTRESTRTYLENKLGGYISPHIDIQGLVNEILDAIDPPEIKPGMWGKFWDRETGNVCYGEVGKIDVDDGDAAYIINNLYFCRFTPIPGLKEAIEKLEQSKAVDDARI